MSRKTLGFEEREAVHQLHEYLHAIKQCQYCREWFPTSLFENYGDPVCEPCLARARVERSSPTAFVRQQALLSKGAARS